MRQIDALCPGCGEITEDVLLRERDALGEYVYPTCKCGATLQRVFLQTAAHVHQDSIPGGMWIRNGICNADGSPRRYDSFSDMRREAKARGMVNHVEHQGTKGGDRNRHTQRFI